MRKEYHIDSEELAHFDEYEYDFMEYYITCQECAICVIVYKDPYEDNKWRDIMYEDLRALGFKTGERVWIDICY